MPRRRMRSRSATRHERRAPGLDLRDVLGSRGLTSALNGVEVGQLHPKAAARPRVEPPRSARSSHWAAASTHGDEAENRPSRAVSTTRKRDRKPAHVQGRKRMARVGIEPTTPRFSVEGFTRAMCPAFEGPKWLHSTESGDTSGRDNTAMRATSYPHIPGVSGGFGRRDQASSPKRFCEGEAGVERRLCDFEAVQDECEGDCSNPKVD